MAAEELTKAGHQVMIAEAMPTPARKFLMAGKSGLNLTKAESPAAFFSKFRGPDAPDFGQMDFGPDDVVRWAENLGQPMFTGSTGRVFPTGMKASPLLRAWLARLIESGAGLRTRWRWVGLAGGFHFATPDGDAMLQPDVTVLALGGASWPGLGSDAAWVPTLQQAGVSIAPFRPANMGFHVAWSAPMKKVVGQAVKGVAIHAGNLIGRGEWVISQAGIEGGGIYELAAAIRDGMPATVDLAPDVDHVSLAARFARPKGKLSLGNWLRRVLGDPVKVALLLEWGQPLPDDPAGWAARTKALPLQHAGPMPIDRAISSAGGIAWSAVTPELELRALPNVFVAGEMLDWEAPTGGYLLTGCIALGRHAGRAAARRLAE
ncbi:TIGR03862 family flavoprotein [Paracoccus sp. 11-3]|uniref:TIGR03862 family flavoprotein n=2 Tax=Paracoccus amoyensis TaxID=2760093 RepID=A0A926JAI5_9RHOB|nr:TIGR03862 family flavoprotein [Paracoccus amoyensis]